jgi:hypothetical protein
VNCFAAATIILARRPRFSDNFRFADFPSLIGTAPATIILHRSEIRKLKSYGSAGFQIYQEGEEDGSGDAAAGGADRLFSPPLCWRCCIAFSNSFW